MKPEKTGQDFNEVKIYSDQTNQKIEETTEQSPRQYQKQQINQIFRVEGDNRAIVLNDGTKDRILIGFKKDAF